MEKGSRRQERLSQKSSNKDSLLNKRSVRLGILLIILELAVGYGAFMKNNTAIDVSNGNSGKSFSYDTPYTVYRKFNNESEDVFGKEAKELGKGEVLNEKEASMNSAYVDNKDVYTLSDTIRHKPYTLEGVILKKYRLRKIPNVMLVRTDRGTVAVYYLDELPMYTKGTKVVITGLAMGTADFDDDNMLVMFAEYRGTKVISK